MAVITISIHAPYKRVRPFLENNTGAWSPFNPRTLQESATNANFYNCRRRNDFNPRTLQESATRSKINELNQAIFQSTHPTRECDL